MLRQVITMNKTLLTDLYQLTMNAAYADNNKDDTATFEMFIRKLPNGWGYFIANGIEDAIDYATNLKFTEEDISYLRSQNLFSEAYLSTLKDFKFEGEIRTVKEGTPVFPNEPILSITGKRTQVQFLESTILNIVNHQTMIATKANRVVNAAKGATVFDFGLRRAQGEDAAMKGARATYIGGAVATSNVMAGREYGIPIKGTHAHSFVMSFDTELEAFRAYAKTFPDHSTLLIDTYDIEQGAKNAAIVAKELAAKGHKLYGVRLDSGDLAEGSHKVRSILNSEGLFDVKIVASNDLNEHKIAELVRRSARIDAYGVGTEMITAKPEAAVSGVYKIVEDSHGGKMKLSPGKESMPGKHQIYRAAIKGQYEIDTITLANETAPGTPLLEVAVKDGVRVRETPTLDEIRNYALAEVAKLPMRLKDNHAVCSYTIEKSDGLQQLTNKLVAEHLYTKEELANSYT